MKALGRELTIRWMTWSTELLEKVSLAIEQAGDALALQGCKLDDFAQKRYDRFAIEQNDYVDELEREVARVSEHEFRDPQHGAPAAEPRPGSVEATAEWLAGVADRTLREMVGARPRRRRWSELDEEERARSRAVVDEMLRESAANNGGGDR